MNILLFPRIQFPHAVRCMLAAAVVCMGFQATAVAQQDTLRWQFQPGQVFNVEMKQEITQRMNMPGQGEMEVPMTMVTYMTWRVHGVDGENFQMEQTITRMKMSMENPMMTIEFDTDDAESEGIAAQIRQAVDPLIGAPISFAMNGRGQISEVALDEETKRALESGMGGGMGGMGGGMFNAEMLEGMISQSSLVFPEEPLSHDATWEQEMTQDLGGMQVNAKNQYTYLGAEEKDGVRLHKIGLKATFNFDDVEGLAGADLSVDQQETEGEIWFDNSRGFMTASQFTSNMVMTIDMMGQQMDMTMEQRVEVKITPGQP